MRGDDAALPYGGRVRTRQSCVVLLAAVAAVTIPACSHSTKKAAIPRPTTASTAPPPQFKVSIASVDVQSMKVGGAPLPNDVRAAVTTTLDTYVSKSIVDPLNSGQAAVGLDAVFTPVALGRLTPGSSDRAALVDDTRPAPGSVVPEKETAVLTALTAQDGTVVVVNAHVDLSVIFTIPTGRIRVERTGDLVLVPSAGGWRIDSYDMVANHNTLPPPPPPTTTTTVKRKKK
jgi:hypothetical protein